MSINRNAIITIIILLLILLYNTPKSIKTELQTREFEQYINIPGHSKLKYLNDSGLLSEDSKNYISVYPYIRGKIVIINTEDKAVDKLYFDLPENLRANNAEEVETIIRLKCENIVSIGSVKGKDFNGIYYTSTGPDGMYTTCYMEIIDKKENWVLYSDEFSGSFVWAKYTSGQRIFERPDDTLLMYIKDLKINQSMLIYGEALQKEMIKVGYSKTMTEGDIWDIGNGWSLEVVDIEYTRPGDMRFFLIKDGHRIDDVRVDGGSMYKYNNNNKFFSVNVSHIIPATDSDNKNYITFEDVIYRK